MTEGRQFTSALAVRSKVPLLFGIAGMSSTGKTYSALRVATGIARVMPGRIHVIDTEAGRALHYADSFEFHHVPFSPPFAALDYLDAIRYCIGDGASCIVIDSASHMHNGQGGMLDQQEQLLNDWCGDDWDKREKNKSRAWIKPKRELEKFVLGLLQLRTNVIFCYRAKEKIKPNPNGAKGEKMLDLGTMAIADDSLIYEMTAQALLEPGKANVPTWEPPLKGEAMQTKMGPFEHELRRIKGPLSEEHGEMMARWALGGSVASRSASPVRKSTDSAPAQPAPTSQPGALDFEGVLRSVLTAETTGDVASIANANRAKPWSPEQRDKLKDAIKIRQRELQT